MPKVPWRKRARAEHKSGSKDYKDEKLRRKARLERTIERAQLDL